MKIDKLICKKSFFVLIINTLLLPFSLFSAPPDSTQIHMAFLMPQMVQAFQKVQNKEVIHNYKLIPVENPGQLFNLQPGENLKMIQGTRIRNFESVGQVAEPGGVTRPLRGVVLDEVILGKIEGQTLPSALVVLVDTIPILLYDSDQSRYTGMLSITLLEDKEGMLYPKKLVEPVLIEVTPGGRAELEPRSFRIDHTNLPSTFLQITDYTTTAPLPVNIKTLFKPMGHTTSVNKESVLKIEEPSKRVQGLGVEKFDITVSLQGNTVSEPVDITLVTEKGSVKTLNSSASAGKPGKFTVTSKGLGEVKVTASGYGVKEATRTFEYTFPWMFFGLAFLGGLIGALARYLFSGKEKKKVSQMIMAGLLSGIVVNILWVAGIVLAGLDLPANFNEISVIAAGIIGGIFLEDKLQSPTKP